MPDPSVGRSGDSRERRLKKALRRVGWRAFWFTLAHPFATSDEHREHLDRTLQQFRQEMRDA